MTTEELVDTICKLIEIMYYGRDIIVDVGGKVWDEYVKIVKEAYRGVEKLPVLVVKKPVIVAYMFYKKPAVILNDFLEMDSLLINKDTVLYVSDNGVVKIPIKKESYISSSIVSDITQVAKLYAEGCADVINGDARLLEKVAENPVVENIVLEETAIPETASYEKMCFEDVYRIREKIEELIEKRNIKYSKETVVSFKSVYSHTDYEKIEIRIHRFMVIDVSFDSTLKSNDCSMIRKHFIGLTGEMSELIVKQIIRYAEVFT